MNGSLVIFSEGGRLGPFWGNPCVVLGRVGAAGAPPAETFTEMGDVLHSFPLNLNFIAGMVRAPVFLGFRTRLMILTMETWPGSMLKLVDW